MKLSHPVLIIATVMAVGIAGGALAQATTPEQPVALKQGVGLDEIAANCSGCHSLDYVRMNAPFLSRDNWKAEVTKMRVAYGAAIDDADSAKIVAYLTANYSP